MKNFEEIKNIDDNIIPELLKEVELKDISFAIRYSDDEVKDKFFSKRGTESRAPFAEKPNFHSAVLFRDKA